MEQRDPLCLLHIAPYEWTLLVVDLRWNGVEAADLIDVAVRLHTESSVSCNVKRSEHAVTCTAYDMRPGKLVYAENGTVRLFQCCTLQQLESWIPIIGRICKLTNGFVQCGCSVGGLRDVCIDSSIFHIQLPHAVNVDQLHAHLPSLPPHCYRLSSPPVVTPVLKLGSLSYLRIEIATGLRLMVLMDGQCFLLDYRPHEQSSEFVLEWLDRVAAFKLHDTHSQSEKKEMDALAALLKEKLLLGN